MGHHRGAIGDTGTGSSVLGELPRHDSEGVVSWGAIWRPVTSHLEIGY